MAEVIQQYHRVAGGYPYFGLLFASLLFLFIIFKKERELWFYPNLFILFILFNPVIKSFLNRYFLIGGVSWRIWWIIPIPFLIAFTFTKILDYVKGREKIALGMLLVGTIIVSGSFVFNSDNFCRTQNRFQIPDEVRHVSWMINYDSKEQGIEHENVVAVYDVSWRLRMYNPEIRMLYGRGVDFRTSPYEEEIRAIINSERPDFEYVDLLLRKAQVYYIVVDRQSIYALPEYMIRPEEMGYKLIGFTESFRVYRTNF